MVRKLQSTVELEKKKPIKATKISQTDKNTTQK